MKEYFLVGKLSSNMLVVYKKMKPSYSVTVSINTHKYLQLFQLLATDLIVYPQLNNARFVFIQYSNFMTFWAGIYN